MINPYAQTFMIAARTNYVAPPRLLPAKEPKQRGRFGLFRRTAVDSEKNI